MNIIIVIITYLLFYYILAHNRFAYTAYAQRCKEPYYANITENKFA